MSERDSILSRLAQVDSPLPLPQPQDAGYVAAAGDLWQGFIANLELLGGRMIDASQVVELARKTKWVDPNAVPYVGSGTDELEIWDAEVGFALAKCAVAQTGSLVFESGPNRCRLTTLAPPVSVVFVAKNSIVPTLAEALAVVAESTRTCVFVTGPSRTADIEGILVRGIHGPKELLVHVV